jgi:PAS domain S-box-containing protein
LSETPSYNELLQSYRDLQLRVTRFSSVEQELINTRDRLDHELVLYRRLQEFSNRAIAENSLNGFYRLAVEAVVDIFETEGAIIMTDKGDFFTEGYNFKEDQAQQCKQTILNFSARFRSGIANQISNADLEKEGVVNFARGLFYHLNDKSSGQTIYILGFISKEKDPLYNEFLVRHETIFAVFAEQVRAILGNLIKSVRLAENSILLKQLSLIATKTKNGVIISDRFGNIEWVNDAFENSTGYTLTEVKGKKPKDFLQGEETSPESKLKLSKALKNRETVEVPVVNYTKEGKPYTVMLEITPIFNEEGQHINFIALQKDVTEELKYRSEILRINQRFEQISNKSEIGIWASEFETHKVEWNEVMYRIYGVQRTGEELDYFNLWLSHIHPDDFNSVNENMHAIVSGTIDQVDEEYRIIRSDNKEVRILSTLTIAERDADGKLVRLIGTSTDITERKSAEQKLKASEEKYRVIIDNMALGLVEVDLEEEILFNNKKYLEFVGEGNESDLILGANPESTLMEKVENGLIVSYTKIEDTVFEVELNASFDVSKTLLLSTSPIYQGDALKGYISIYLDITPIKSLQRNLENALLERNEFIQQIDSVKQFYESVLNHTPSEIAVIDANAKVLFVNNHWRENESAWSKLNGQSLLQIAQNNLSEFDSIRNLIYKLNTAMAQNSLLQFEEERASSGGSSTSILRNILPYSNEAGLLEYLVVSGTEITELKQIQIDLELKNEELNKINSELDKFVYSVSHDLRSPLLSIKGILSLVFKTAQLDEKTQQYLKLAETSVLRLDGTIKEILNYSRNARFEIELDEFDLSNVINAVIDDLRFSEESKVNFMVEMPNEFLLKSDKMRVEVILKNLIGNAVKYARKDIHDAYVKIIVSRRDHEFEIKIEDNGEGIAEENLSKIFDMFYRATSSSVGTGLGLYICKEMVQKLNGKLFVESVLKKGSIFTLILPANT